MLPTFRQRIVIAIGVILGGIVWMQVAEPLAAANASTGISLADASIGLPLAVILVAAAALPAVAVGLFASSWGNPLAGVFVVAFALLMLAATGGSIDGFFWRSALPGRYGALILETVLWTGGLLALLWIISRVRPMVQKRYPTIARANEHYGAAARLLHVDSRALAAGAVTAGVGGLLGNLLIQSWTIGQVLGALVLAFAIAALVAQTVVPNAHPLGILLAPAAVAIAAYLYVLVTQGTGDEVLHAIYRNALPGLVLGLPIHYLSAGLAGATLGIGMAQSLDHARTTGVAGAA